MTPAERRGALALLAIFVLGAVRDLWETRPGRIAPPAPANAAATMRAAPADTAEDPAGVSSAPDPGGRGLARVRMIDLNRASVAELDELPGVGPVLAGRIVEYRRVHGPFRAVEELLAIRGVGPKSFGRLRPRVSVGVTGPPTTAP
jgi:competence protein ComEA